MKNFESRQLRNYTKLGECVAKETSLWQTGQKKFKEICPKILS